VELDSFPVSRDIKGLRGGKFPSLATRSSETFAASNGLDPIGRQASLRDWPAALDRARTLVGGGESRRGAVTLCTTSRGSGASGALPFPGADSIFSSLCGAICGRLRAAMRASSHRGFPRALRRQLQGPTARLRRNRDSDRTHAQSRDAIDSLKVGPRHRVKGYQERLLETAHGRCKELGGRLAHAASENVSNPRAHALLANVLPLRDRSAAARGRDDPTSRLALAWRFACRASTDRSRGTANGAVSMVFDIRPSPSRRSGEQR
jgi:hypothetical protein